MQNTPSRQPDHRGGCVPVPRVKRARRTAEDCELRESLLLWMAATRVCPKKWFNTNVRGWRNW
jgi:hypothetical protein